MKFHQMSPNPAIFPGNIPKKAIKISHAQLRHQERLDLVGDQRTRAREMVAAGQVRSGGAGAGVQLGLGAGARGSMAAALRGRNVARSSQGWTVVAVVTMVRNDEYTNNI